MANDTLRPRPSRWALKLHEAAAELRLKPGRTANAVTLANRLERYAEAILFPQLPRWRADRWWDRPVEAPPGGDD